MPIGQPDKRVPPREAASGTPKSHVALQVQERLWDLERARVGWSRQSSSTWGARSLPATPLAGIVGTMLPLIERTGVATAQQVGIEPLQARLAAASGNGWTGRGGVG